MGTLRRNALRAALGLVLIALLVRSAPSLADTRNGTYYCNDPTCSDPIAGIAYQYAASHVRITKVVFFEFDYGTPTFSVPGIAGCINFINDGPQLISSISFRFWPKSTDDRFWPTLVVKGPIPVGVLQYKDAYVVPNPVNQGYHSECGQAWGTGAFVLHVTYADGSVWDAPPDAPAGSTPQATSAEPPVPPPSN